MCFTISCSTLTRAHGRAKRSADDSREQQTKKAPHAQMAQHPGNVFRCIGMLYSVVLTEYSHGDFKFLQVFLEFHVKR